MNSVSQLIRAVTVFLAIIVMRICSQPYQYPFQDPAQPIETRIVNLVSLLTQSEKIQLLASSAQTVSRLGFTTTKQVEGYHGAAMGGPAGWESNASVSTQFCQGYGMGETWDTSMIRQLMDVEATEFRYVLHRLGRAGLVVRAPNCDLGRDPRWGRTEECYGEDPFLVGTLTQAAVRGLQGNDTHYIKCASLMKHFLANSNENTRTTSNSIFDQRLFREYYSMPFWMGSKAGSECMMAAYNKVNGIPCAVQPALKNPGRNEWGMNGILCDDGGALGMLVSAHHYYADTPTAAAACIKAGISQFLGSYYSAHVTTALSRGLLTVSDIDSAIKNNLRMFFRLGIFDPAAMVPYTNVGTVDPWTTTQHMNLCRLVTQKSIVLLKNNNNLLPLNRSAITSIAVIGENADSVCLDWYSGTPPYKVSVLAGIRAKVGTGVTVNYARTNAGSAAVNAARASTVALVVVGNHPFCNTLSWGTCPERSEGKEQRDRDSITFEATEETLIRDVYAANANTIVLILSSFPYAAVWAKANVPAILHMTHNSQELGNALADVLFGDYNPGGKTTQTWPSSVSQLPTMLDYNIRNGRTYMYFTGTPQYPFGYGLSYTTFAYATIRPSAAVLDARSGVTVSVDVRNSGSVAGEEVVQLYVKHLNSTVSRPIKEIRGFQRVALAAGETKTVSMPLSAMSVAYWDSTAGSWVAECDNIQIQVGASSADIRLLDTLAVTNCGPVSTSIREQLPGTPGMANAPAVLSGVRIVQKGAVTGLVINMNRAADIDLRLYRLDGGLLLRVNKRGVPAGEHFIPLGAVQPAPGVYLVSGRTGEQTYTSKCCIR